MDFFQYYLGVLIYISNKILDIPSTWINIFMKFFILIRISIYNVYVDKYSIQSNSESFYQKIWKTICWEMRKKTDREAQRVDNTFTIS